jgi:hypothetical protein
MHQEKSSEPRGTFFRLLHYSPYQNGVSSDQGTRMRDKQKMNDMTIPRQRRRDDGLGANTDIGAKLRALYGSVQDEGIPDHLLDLLEKLDQIEQQSSVKASQSE